MAEDAVNAAIKSGNLEPANKCLTYSIQLMGADGWDPASFTVLAQQYVRMKKTHSGRVVPGVMDTSVAKHLSHAYGTLAERVAVIAQVCSLFAMEFSSCLFKFSYSSIEPRICTRSLLDFLHMITYLHVTVLTLYFTSILAHKHILYKSVNHFQPTRFASKFGSVLFRL